MSCAGGDPPDILCINDRALDSTSEASDEDGTVLFVVMFLDWLPLDRHCDYSLRAAVLPVVVVLRAEWVRAFSSWC